MVTVTDEQILNHYAQCLCGGVIYKNQIEAGALLVAPGHKEFIEALMNLVQCFDWEKWTFSGGCYTAGKSPERCFNASYKWGKNLNDIIYLEFDTQLGVWEVQGRGYVTDVSSEGVRMWWQKFYIENTPVVRRELGRADEYSRRDTVDDTLEGYKVRKFPPIKKGEGISKRGWTALEVLNQ